MKKVFLPFFGAILWGGFTTASAEEGTVEWGYTGKSDPAHWGTLSKDFALCDTGRNQSPINLTQTIEIDADLSEIIFTYPKIPLQVVNNGHTVQVNYTGNGQITLDGRTFNLGQFHFHAPSEHQIEGKSFPLEVHLVHKDTQGEITVIGVLFTEGPANPLIDTVWQHIPTKVGQNAFVNVAIDALNLLPKDKAYYRYSGSITVPPCSEGVNWIVMKEPITASAEQIKKFHDTMHHDTNRPVQPVHVRPVLK